MSIRRGHGAHDVIAARPLPLRDRAVVLAALGVVVAVAWVYLAGHEGEDHDAMATAAMMEMHPRGIALLSPMMVSVSPVLGALLLAGAGLYQLSPLKDVCIRQCQAPILFMTEHWRPGVTGAFKMGFRHGGYCVGCCWVLMSLLFVVGVMNLVWVAIISAFVLAEKITVVGSVLGRRMSGVGLIAAAVLLIVAVGRAPDGVRERTRDSSSAPLLR